ncbi:tryptophan--tRNA ligase, cytoplasmic-like [Schistocerca gregaria]|uniref:tryptophan--tRNA ligase, cytoplasmic-like n=1 Tax=Schistocerca gregaria TaxID=7010 RepID=UPI00211E7BC2|nr:tryptophan--tRNA ligase, cytoplasmic-like [Schistocerca gregaria]
MENRAAGDDGFADDEFVVNIENVSGKVDYSKLIQRFGSEPIMPGLVERIERLTGRPAHPFLSRGFFFSHRELDKLLDAYEGGRKFYLYTGRGPSTDSMHLGHLIPFIFCKYLQDAFDVPVVIQMTDDEKYLYKQVNLESLRQYTIENVRDIIACGFDVNKTFIFSNLEYIQHLYPNVLRIQKNVTVNQVRAIFGVNDSSNIGKVSFSAIQAAPSFASSFPQVFEGCQNMLCLIPCGIDQDPYFLMTRDVAPRLGSPKPHLIHSKFLPALQGMDKKMSSSVEESAIFLTDSEARIREKVMKYAFSGGQSTISDHRRLGADLNVDISYQYLSFFLEDEKELQRIRAEYSSGKMLTVEVKKILVGLISELVRRHQAARSGISDDLVREFMSVRKLNLSAP